MKRFKRFLSVIIALAITLSLVSAENVYADEGESHIIVNQVYGGSEDGYASHSFIELYNPSETPVDLIGWSLQYKSSPDGGASGTWQKLDLTGWIGAKNYYLVRCGAITDASNVRYSVPEGNQEWELSIHNKGFSVVLTDSAALLGDDFAGDISGRTDYVDCLAVQGNDTTEEQQPIAYEKEFSSIQSKKKGVIRVGFADTDDNAADVTTVDYSGTVSAENAPHKGTYSPEGESKTAQTITFSVTSPLELKVGESTALGAAAQTALTYESSNEAVVSASEDGTVTANKAGKAQITVTAAESDIYSSATATVDILVKQNFTLKTDGFENANALPLKKLGSYVTGISNPEGGVAEIVSYDKKNNKAWVVNGATGKLDIISLDPVTGKTGTELAAVSIDVRAITESVDNTFSYGDMTSVSVNSELGIAAVALQDADFMKDGRVAVLNTDGELLALLKAGCQPDMVTFTPDGTKILVANEGEARTGGLGNTATDPKGSVTIISINKDDITTSDSVNVTFDSFDGIRAQLVAENIILAKDAAPSLDLEPEYIAADNKKAYIALQEANAIAVVDLETRQYDGIYSLGFKDLSDSKNATDVEDDGEYKADTYQDTVAAYMPDGIALYSIDGRTYLLTANEGDAREWGDYVDETKKKLTTTSGAETNKVRVIDESVTDGLPSGKNVMFGARSFSVYEVTSGGLNQVYDSANDFEAKTAEYIPSYFNASNDDNEFDSRSQKKGPEPESVTVGKVGEKTYAFIALERIGGIMMYDISDPSNISYVNYINSRDFAEDPSQANTVALSGDVAPEGLYFIDSESSPSGTPILLAAFEVSGTVVAYSIGSEPDGNTKNPTDDVDAPTDDTDTPTDDADTPTDNTDNPADDTDNPSDDADSSADEDVTTEVHIENGAPDVEIRNSEALLNAVLSPAELERVRNGERADVSLTVRALGAGVSEEDAALVQMALGENTVGMYLDITLLKKIGTGDWEAVSETTGEIIFDVEIPQNLRNTDTSKTRTYRMIRVHDGSTEVLEGNYDNGTFTFATDRFSTYALIYCDTSTEVSGSVSFTDNNASETGTTAQIPVSDIYVAPKTGDNGIESSIVLLLLFGGLLFVEMGRKKLYR